MRTFRLIGLVLMTFVIAFNFAACSDDNENSIPNIGNENGKKLRKWIVSEGTPSGRVVEAYTTTFEYDSQGRMQKIEELYTDEEEIISQVTGIVIWNEDNIHIEYNNGDYVDYILENGLISKIKYVEEVLLEENPYFWYITPKYDNEGRLISIVDEDSDNRVVNFNWTWNNNRLESFSKNEYELRNYTYEYTPGTSCQNYFPYVELSRWGDILEDGLLLAYPKLIGLQLNMVPNRVISDNDSQLLYLAQTDEEGYVTTLITKTDEENISEMHTFEWE